MNNFLDGQRFNLIIVFVLSVLGILSVPLAFHVGGLSIGLPLLFLAGATGFARRVKRAKHL